MSTNSRKASEAYRNGGELERRADAAEKSTAVFSDDPEAVAKLRQKIDKAEKRQDMMRQANKVIRSKPKNEPTPDKLKALAELGLYEEVAEGLFKPDFCNRIGFPSYELTNNNANTRRMKERIETLLKQANDKTTETQHGEITVVENVEENRIQIFFPDKPSDEVRRELKASGFRWARSLGCWQRHRSTNAAYYANKIVGGAA
jgi:membrane-associated HD superfamily phosphohydrolase